MSHRFNSEVPTQFHPGRGSLTSCSAFTLYTSSSQDKKSKEGVFPSIHQSVPGRHQEKNRPKGCKSRSNLWVVTTPSAVGERNTSSRGGGGEFHVLGDSVNHPSPGPAPPCSATWAGLGDASIHRAHPQSACKGVTKQPGLESDFAALIIQKMTLVRVGQAPAPTASGYWNGSRVSPGYLPFLV